MDKKSFILHIDSLSVLGKLSMEQRGQLFTAIWRFHIDGEEPDDQLISIVFDQFKNQFIRDNEKWETFQKNQSEKGKKSAKKRQKKPEKPNNDAENEPSLTAVESGSKKTNQKEPRLNPVEKKSTESTNSVSVSVNVSDSVSDSVSVNGKKTNTSPPSSEKEQTVTQKFLAAYNDFLLPKTGTTEQFTTAGRAALKKTIDYLKIQVKTANPDWGEAEIDDGAVKAWQFILSHYQFWEPFHQKQLKINQIHSNLINIIAACKKQKSNGKPSHGQLAAEVISILSNQQG